MGWGKEFNAEWLAEQQAKVRRPAPRPVAAPIAVEWSPPPAARAKYGNTRTVEDGITFDSKKEAKRWRELRLLLLAGEILSLGRQVGYSLPGQTIYWADFVYEPKTGDKVVEDVKSPQTRKTQAYRIKVRQMKAIHNIEIQEV